MIPTTLPRWLKVTLIILLVFLTIAVRTGSDHQTDFDSYWLHGMAESIQIHGSALWVFHPASLPGFYPMSYPSGTPFFLAVFSELTGLDMNTTVLVTSILLGLLIIGLVFLLALELFRSEYIAFIAALIVALSPTLILYTAFNAGGRVFVMPFSLLFFWSLLVWQKRRSWVYLVLAVVSFIFAFLAHRTAVFLLPLLFAFLLAEFYQHIPHFWTYIRDHRHFKKHVHSRYEKNRYFLLFDMGLVLLILIFIKLFDLIIRGRLAYNFDRLVITRVDALVQSSNFFLIFFIAVSAIIIMIILVLFLRFVLKGRPLKKFFGFFHRHYHQMFVRPQHYFLHLLLIVAVVLFFGQFFGNSFYAPSFYEYQQGVLSGGDPISIFVNVMINYTTAITLVFVFVFVGFVSLLYKKHKSFPDWMLIFFFIMFSGLLLDKRYTRIFLIPFFGILASYGILRTYAFLKRFSRTKVIDFTHVIFVVIIFLSLVIGSQMPLLRTYYTGEDSSGFTDVDAYWETGQYIRSIGGDFSTLTTKELVAGVTIFASSGVPGGSHNIYYFVHEDYLQPIPYSFDEVKDRVKSGDKIQSLWYLEDWIFGGHYYLGRHARYTFEHSFTDRINQRVIDDYHERYYIHDKDMEGNDFLESIVPVKNIVYDTPKSIVYDIEVGR